MRSGQRLIDRAVPKHGAHRWASRGNGMFSLRDKLKFGALAVLILAGTQTALAQEAKIDLFKVITVKDEIVIGLSADELKALGGADASAVAHALAQKGDLTVWQYNVHRGPQWRIAAGADGEDRPARQFLTAGRALRHALRGTAASMNFAPRYK
jgi:hypothetical protein